MGVPLNQQFNVIFPYKPTIWGYPHFRKPPYVFFVSSSTLGVWELVGKKGAGIQSQTQMYGFGSLCRYLCMQHMFVFRKCAT